VAAPYPPEWLALLDGLKPGLRLWRDDARALAELRAAERRGLATARTPLPPGPRGPQSIIYLARTPAAARALQALEAAILPTRGVAALTAADVEQHRGLGAALGYPACCIDAFVGRLGRGVTRLADGSSAHEDFVAVAEAVARSRAMHARLNMFPRDHGSTWLSHVPCGFDCALSIAYAAALRAAFAVREPAAAIALDAALAEPVAITRDGARVAPELAPATACRLVFAIDLDPAGARHVP
jgi:hypothetical protein